MKKELTKLFIFVLSAISIILLAVRYFAPYQGDGIELKGSLLSIGYPIYEIQFPSFPLKEGTTEQTYHFTRTCNCKLDLRFYLIAKSNKQVYFLPGKPKPAFLNKIKIVVKLLENKKEVLYSDKIEIIPTKNTVYLVIPPETKFHDGASIEYNFSKNSTYELKISLEVPEKPPQPLKVQYGLAPQYGYGCAIEACKQVENEYIQETQKIPI